MAVSLTDIKSNTDMLCKWKLKSRVYKYFPHSHQLSSSSSSWFHSILSLPMWAGVRRCWENDLSRLNSRETEEEKNQHRTLKYIIAVAADNPRELFIWRISLFVTCNLRSFNINFFFCWYFFVFSLHQSKWVKLVLYTCWSLREKFFPKHHHAKVVHATWWKLENRRRMRKNFSS